MTYFIIMFMIWLGFFSIIFGIAGTSNENYQDLEWYHINFPFMQMFSDSIGNGSLPKDD